MIPAVRSIELQHLPKRQIPAKFLMLSGLVSIILLEKLYSGGRQINLSKAFLMNVVIASLIEAHNCPRLVTADWSILMAVHMGLAFVQGNERRKQLEKPIRQEGNKKNTCVTRTTC